MKVAVVAAPLITRGGVFRSTIELVEAARRARLDWHAVIATRTDLGTIGVDPPEALSSFVFSDSGLAAPIRVWLAQ